MRKKLVNNKHNAAYHSGLSGLQLNIPQYLFPAPFEKASRLTYYSSLFNSIEINSSFYKIPQVKTIAKWEASIPDHFRFTFKLWKGITHVKGLNFNEDDVIAFFAAINAVNQKKGCLLIQFPPSLTKQYIGQLQELLVCINKTAENRQWKIAVEFRNNSWYHQDVYDVLNAYNTAIVVQDKPIAATPLLNHSSNFLYIRMHGPSGNYRGSYSEDFLTEYATYINEWLNEGKIVFVYFNNTMGDAFNNANTLNSMVSESFKLK